MPIPTPRLLLLTLAGAVPVALAGSHAAALIVALCWLAGAGLVSFLDARFVPRSSELQWRRDHDSKLSLGEWNQILLRASNTTGRAVSLRVRDRVPQLLSPRGDSGAGQMPARGEWALRYAVFPVHRGDYTLGPPTVRLLGPLGLAWRQRTVELEDAVKVYPNLLAIRTYEALLRVGRPEEAGLVNARRWGEGTEFERLRAYTSCDEFRRINWKATARRGAPIVTDYQPERSQTVLLALDAGRMMSLKVPLPEEGGAGQPAVPRALSRLDYAVNASLLLAFACRRHGDQVGLLAFGDRIERYSAPRSGRRQFALVTDALYDLEAAPVEPDFRAALAYLAAHHRRRSLVILFTDFSEPEGARELVSHAAHLSKRHLLLVATILDPAVRDLATQPIKGSRSVYERAVARSVLDTRESLLRQLRIAGVLTIDTTADSLTPSVVNRYLEIKARGLL